MTDIEKYIDFKNGSRITIIPADGGAIRGKLSTAYLEKAKELQVGRPWGRY